MGLLTNLWKKEEKCKDDKKPYLCRADAYGRCLIGCRVSNHNYGECFEKTHHTPECSKCKEKTTKLIKDHPSESAICHKCFDISLTGSAFLHRSIDTELHEYIWNKSIKHKGVKWFRKARDKLIKKDKIAEAKAEKAAKKRLEKFVKVIEKW